MISVYFGLTVTMRPVNPKLRRLRMTRLPRGSRAKLASASRCDAPTMATDLGAISGVRSRQTMDCEGIGKVLIEILQLWSRGVMGFWNPNHHSKIPTLQHSSTPSFLLRPRSKRLGL